MDQLLRTPQALRKIEINREKRNLVQQMETEKRKELYPTSNKIDWLNINVTLFSCTRAFDDGPRNLNHGQVTWMTPELAPFSPNYHTTPTGKRFNSQQI
ncbi:hypothetical protein TNCV_3176361 [Trichonephila clavipes]|nr:hypothetical protein TNCV_3176361 [Trichonephila clavipes]